MKNYKTKKNEIIKIKPIFIFKRFYKINKYILLIHYRKTAIHYK